MNPEQRFQLNEPNVIQEVIDGEAIIADLGKGLYFSLDELGSRIWDALVSGCSVAEVSEICASKYSADAQQGVQDLLKQLLDEQLIVPAEIDGSGVEPDTFFKGIADAYMPPQLSKYTDMEQLLLLDPIHEVDETGWPNEPDADQNSG